MPPKRKSALLDAIDAVDLTRDDDSEPEASAPVAKKARTSAAADVAEGSSSAPAKKGKGKAKAADEAPKNWWEVKLEGEDEVR